MGFGKKMDYQNSKEVNLDTIYREVIKPVFEEDLTRYKLIRADEIAGSAIIDVGMYALLLNADLVIADITTLNPNAIYELGIRHAAKPFSTIIMAQKSCKIPFDLNHCRFLKYNDIEGELDKTEVNTIRIGLKEYVFESEKQLTDSPLYTFLPETIPPVITAEEYGKLVKEATDKTDTISFYLEQAAKFVLASKFKDAIPIWIKLKELLPNNDYVVQQLALATYKSEYPTATKALENALDVIKKVSPNNSLDLETLGITGAIYKRLFRINRNFDYLMEAIRYYRKGYIIANDYYNGENYANCLLLYSQKDGLDKDTLFYLLYESRKTYDEIIAIVLEMLTTKEYNFWMYSTLAVCYFVLSDQENHQKYQELFYNNCSSEWQKKTYQETIEELRNIIVKYKRS